MILAATVCRKPSFAGVSCTSTRLAASSGSGGTARLLPIALVLLSMLWVVCVRPAMVRAAEDSTGLTQQLREQAVDVLRRALKEEACGVKVQAAECLTKLHYRQGVADELIEELAAGKAEPECLIGVWRALARAANNDAQRAQWIDKIKEVFLNAAAGGRLAAAEALARLGYEIADEEVEAFEQVAEQRAGPMAVYAQWALALAADSEARRQEWINKIRAVFLDTDSPGRLEAAEALVRLGYEISKEEVGAFEQVAEETAGPAAVYARWALLQQGEHEGELGLSGALDSADLQTRVVAVSALAELGARRHLPLLAGLLEDADAGVRIAAAEAVLRIGRRGSHRLAGWDWMAIGLYALGMIAVGWYYSRRTATREDYLLGGRTMRPLAVGLSLFATLLSTLSYLAWPGEIIKHGPMILFIYLAHPFTILVVGWFVIPFIMKLKVTSAYEILEVQLGLSVRMLGSLFFLTLRLLWMATIIYATTSIVLVPLLGLDQSATVYVCAVLGLITVIYTSMGGLRAVVLTDVIQTLILFGAAILAIVLVSIHMGGVGAWWPHEWAPHWAGFKFYDPTVRVTMVGAALSTFTWWVCTSGSDQMAIQRYLATRDAKAARRVLIISLCCDVTVGMFLALLGLALLGYFVANPHFLPDGQTIYADADKLFPRFVVFGLPAGLSGLVVAGLLAAAMSSLSSGVNSSCSVITVDFIDRFRRRKNRQAETDHVKLAKIIAVLVGIVVVLLSALVGLVEGNLLEICYKVVNVLVTPLFGLFFMAMFIRFATSPGTIIGAFCGLAVVVVINYCKQLTGGVSFLWAMPLGFVVQIAVGSVASLVPFGRLWQRVCRILALSRR